MIHQMCETSSSPEVKKSALTHSNHPTFPQSPLYTQFHFALDSPILVNKVSIVNNLCLYGINLSNIDVLPCYGDIL